MQSSVFSITSHYEKIKQQRLAKDARPAAPTLRGTAHSDRADSRGHNVLARLGAVRLQPDSNFHHINRIFSARPTFHGRARLRSDMAFPHAHRPRHHLGTGAARQHALRIHVGSHTVDSGRQQFRNDISHRRGAQLRSLHGNNDHHPVSRRALLCGGMSHRPCTDWLERTFRHFKRAHIINHPADVLVCLRRFVAVGVDSRTRHLRASVGHPLTAHQRM